MRTILAVMLVCSGLLAIHVFSSGALEAGLLWTTGGWESACEKVWRPFEQTGPLALIVLTLGILCLASGFPLAPSVTSYTTTEQKGTISRHSEGITTERALEVVLVFNVLLVGAILALLILGVSQAGPPEVLGYFYALGLLEALLGLAIALFSFFRKTTSGVKTRKFRPILTVSAGLNFLQILIFAGIFFCGVLS